MSQYTSYWLYQRYEQRGDQDPIPTYPNVYSVDADGTMPLVVRRENDDQCGWYCDPPIYQWVTMPITEDYICESCQEPETLIRYVQTDYTACSYEDETPYEDMYLTIVPKTDGGILLSGGSSYSIDDTDEWITTAPYSSTLLVQMEIGHRYKIKSSGGLVKIIQLRGNWMNVEYPYDFFYDVEGNIMSLLYGDDFIGKTDIPSYSEDETFFSLFSDCYGLISAKNLVLPATRLVFGVYSNMFKNCALLEDPPALPATIISGGCYREMFKNCVSLKTAPTLPATNAPRDCYYEMFKGCVSLTQAPELPATTVDLYSYYGMFRGCTSLVTGPSELPATEVPYWAYREMFAECFSLTTGPTVLSATTLGKHCCYEMFAGCLSLTQAPTVLPATTLAERCYAYMFSGCTSLTQAPELPATTLAVSCYAGMFAGCLSLTQIPTELPATTLAVSCYAGMFKGCVYITKAPDLPAEYLPDECYVAMFEGCTNLNYIKCLGHPSMGDEDTLDWVRNVSSTGTFVKSSTATFWSSGKSGIPNGWTIINE